MHVIVCIHVMNVSMQVSGYIHIYYYILYSIWIIVLLEYYTVSIVDFWHNIILYLFLIL